MKKRTKILVYISFIVIFLGLLTTAGFADSSVYVDRYTIFAEIQTDGSMDVQEIITYNFSGSFNGVLRDIDFTGASAIEDIRVYLSTQIAPDNLDVAELKEFSLVDSASKGDSGVVTIKDRKNIKNIMIFSPSDSERKTFVVTYTLRDVINRYEDIAELYWYFIPSGWDFKLKNVDVYIKLPEGAEVDELKIFGHGALTGESKRVDAQNILLTAPLISLGESLEARLLFPTKLVSDMQEIISKNALDDIMNEERRWAEEANFKREQHRRTYKITNTLIAILAVLNIVAFIYIYTKYDKEYRVNRDIKYYRELPGDYSPAEMGVLYRFGSIDTKDIMATMMDLVRRGYLKLETIEVEKRGLFGKKREEDYRFTQVRDDNDGLSDHEAYLLEWFIKDIGNGKYMTLSDLEHYTETTSRAKKFQRKYETWQGKVRAQAEEREFFDEEIIEGKLLGSLFASIEIALSIYIVYLGNNMGIITVVLGIVFLVYSIAFKRRSPYGAEQYNLWKAFRRFILDFSNMKDYTPPSIVIWEHYLVYAISLGVAKEVIKQLKIVIPPEELSNPSLTYLYATNMNRQFMMMDSIDRATRTFEKTIDTAISKSVESSTTGSGGGFSGGGGGGGGSGGGGGAF